MGPVPVREPFGRNQLDQTLSHVFEHGLLPLEEICERTTRFWRVRMQGEVGISRLDLIFGLKLSNAPGAQVAPWSHEVGEHLEDLGG